MASVPAVRLPRHERRAQLLEAARAVFVESGYYAAGMDDIAERAGVSKPVLYRHFPGKLDLYVALLDVALASLLDAIGAAVTSTSDNKARVRQTVAAYFAFVDDPDGSARLVFQSDMGNEPAVRARLDRVNEQIAQCIADLIAQDTGLRPQQARVLGSGMAGLAEVAARAWLAGEADAVTRDEAVDLVSGLAWRGIGGFPLSHPATGQRA